MSGKNLNASDTDDGEGKRSEEDATMNDTTLEKPPDKPVPWSKKLFRAGEWHRPTELPEDLIKEGLVSISYPHGPNATPCITVKQDVVSYLDEPWKNSVVIKLLGRMISFGAFEKTLRQMWSPAGRWKIIDLPNEFFLVNFELKADMEGALSSGPWSMFGHYMMVKQWEPLFDPEKSVINTTGVWVRISGLPFALYERNLLWSVSMAIGKPLRIDEHTLTVARGRFARVCVEINLSEPLKGDLLLNGKRLKLEYENLHTICFGCGKYGHLAEQCPCRSKGNMTVDQNKGDARKNSEGKNQEGTSNANGQAEPCQSVAGDRQSTEEAFGPWMVVARKARPTKGKNITKQDTPYSMGENNRFAQLGDLEDNLKGKEIGKGKSIAKGKFVPGADYVSNTRGNVAKHQGHAKRRRQNEPGKGQEAGPAEDILFGPSTSYGPAMSKGHTTPALRAITNTQRQPNLTLQRKPVTLSKAQDKENVDIRKKSQYTERVERKGPGLMTFTPMQDWNVESSIGKTQTNGDNEASMDEVSSDSSMSQGTTVVPETQM